MNLRLEAEIEEIREQINEELNRELARIQEDTKLRIQAVINEKSAKLDAKLADLMANDRPSVAH